MAQKLTLERIVGDNAKIGKPEFRLLCEVMEQGAGDQQIPVYDLGIEPGEKICQLQHIAGVHQKTGQKTVVYAFCGGDAAEGFQVPVQHGLGNQAVVRIFQGGNQPADLCQSLVLVNGGYGNQTGGVTAILRQRHSYIGKAQLGTSFEFRHIAPNLDDSADILRGANRAAVVPYLHIYGACFIGNHGAEKGFAVGRYLLVCLLQ